MEYSWVVAGRARWGGTATWRGGRAGGTERGRRRTEVDPFAEADCEFEAVGGAGMPFEQRAGSRDGIGRQVRRVQADVSEAAGGGGPRWRIAMEAAPQRLLERDAGGDLQFQIGHGRRVV